MPQEDKEILLPLDLVYVGLVPSQSVCLIHVNISISQMIQNNSLL